MKSTECIYSDPYVIICGFSIRLKSYHMDFCKAWDRLQLSQSKHLWHFIITLTVSLRHSYTWDSSDKTDEVNSAAFNHCKEALYGRLEQRVILPQLEDFKVSGDVSKTDFPITCIMVYFYICCWHFPIRQATWPPLGSMRSQYGSDNVRKVPVYIKQNNIAYIRFLFQQKTFKIRKS